ncbi:MAG: diaminopimelate epimerase [Planctomycetaceae bacterium]|nr:diaminopimelate epimerase [Planctomycetaceae bacterium]
MDLSFVKMHGCGNDYVFVDAMHWCRADLNRVDFAALARSISNRHLSVGGDGLVVMLAAVRDDIDVRIRMFNADGSEGAMCGNAIRCVAMWLHQSKRSDRCSRIMMQDRIIDAEVLSSDATRKQAIVRVSIGSPATVVPGAEGMSKFVRSVSLHDIQLSGRPVELTSVSMGNPHAILYVDDVELTSVDKLGPQIERHREFPDRTNVEFVQVLGPDAAIVRVWERGSGETQACGSGACAAAVAGWTQGLFAHDNPVRIQMRGGELLVRISDEHMVTLEGPAKESFRGSLAFIEM